jgi:hypothetical protein
MRARPRRSSATAEAPSWPFCSTRRSRLQLERQLADLIEEQCCVRELEAPGLRGMRAVNAPRLRPKSRPSARRHRRAIDDDERRSAAGSAGERPREQFFVRAITEEQDGTVSATCSTAT